MARPLKTGLDYFPLDVDILYDIKVRKIVKKSGEQAFSILIGLLCNIYKDKGYYAEYSDDLCFHVADTLDVSEESVNEVITKALEVGFFDMQMYERHRILTSESIQARFESATLKRKESVINDIYWISSANNPVNDSHNTQSKVKETKVKESTEKKSKSKEGKPEQSLTANINIDGRSYIISNRLHRLMSFMSENKPYINTLCVNNGIKNSDNLIRYLKLFFVKLENEGSAHTDTKDIKQHFANWLRLQLERDKRPSEKIKYNNKHNFAKHDNTISYSEF